MFENIQSKLAERKAATPKRSPRNKELWFTGLWECEESGLKLSANSQAKSLRVKHPDHHDKKLPFKQAEFFISEYLTRIGKRLEALGESDDTKLLLEQLSHDEWMKELKLEHLFLQLQDYLAERLQEGLNKIGNAEIVLDYDDEGGTCVHVLTNNSLLEVFCQMAEDDMHAQDDRAAALRAERSRLAADLMRMMDKDQFIIDSYHEKIAELGREIEEASSLPKFDEWWKITQDELEQLRQRHQQVQQAVEQDEYVQKSKALHSLIDRIVCHWDQEPTTDRRYKSGVRTFCRAVTVYGTTPVMGEQGEPIPTMTIETPSRWSS